MTAASFKGLTVAQLRAVEAVARLGSFSAAAQELNVSQPSVSNHIAAAERLSRALLFNRQGHSIRPGPALEVLLPRIRALLALYADVERDLVAARDLAMGALRIGYSTYQIAMPVIGRFMQAHPGIEIEARALASADVLAGVEAGRLDIGFVTGREVPAGMQGWALVETPVVLVAPPDHPLADKGWADWAEIAELSLIQREKGSGTRQLFEGAAKLARIAPKTVLALGSWGSIVAMVREGLGLGVALAAELTKGDGLVPVRISEGRLTAQHFIICQKDMAHVAAVQAFVSLASAQYDGSVKPANS
ncbi:DNA-binding transcriptional LysR family regulator [Rhodovulum bhavnagarense]|uniref:DNA-binding transcriptional LysR family regulator n=1 Tax=Rhodovulum bhavnagarense TaxID=992286 RepID=A0A4R2RB21_9RHOB|nr:LysR substrate-binding domain-containing protein [Rhodovulum bhavnagarense]TCP60512.1 DNA-binding transcriptional LysR family regulator [Rhodovulum bhavnagarense]